MERNVYELDNKIKKYSELLNNILNFQGKKTKLKNESFRQNKKSSANTKSTSSFKASSFTNLAPASSSVVIGVSNHNSGSFYSKTKLPNPLLTAKKSSVVKNSNKNNSLFASNAPIVTPKPILKPAKSIEIVDNTSKRFPSCQPSLSNLLHHKSKSAENVQQEGNKTKAGTCLIKSRPITSSCSNISISEIVTSKKLNDESESLTSKVENECKEAKTPQGVTSFLENGKFDYLELLEYLTEKSKHLKQENRKFFISKIISLLTNTEPMNNQANNVESSDLLKLDTIKYDIESLKKQLQSQNGMANSSFTQQNSQSHQQHQSATQQSNQLCQNISSVGQPNELNNALNLIISNYLEKLTKMQQQIDELNSLNKCLLYVENNFNDSSCSKLVSSQATHQQQLSTAFERQEREKLEKELQSSREKCKQLECILEEKNKEIDGFKHLFREVNDSVNTLVREIENKERKPEPVDFLPESKSIATVLENLAKFESQIKRQHCFDNCQNSSLPNLCSGNHVNAAQENNKHIYVNLQEYQDETLNFNSANSNTLVDADSSFNDVLRQSYSFKKMAHAKIPERNIGETMSHDHHHIYANTSNEEERIIVNMDTPFKYGILDDMSITTLQTTSNESSFENMSGNKCEAFIFNDNVSINNFIDSSLVISTNNNDVINNTRVASNNSCIEDDIQFQENLKKLDQKIFKVKQLLESMKVTS